MSVVTEAEEWRLERERIERKTARQRAGLRWFSRPDVEPRDMFAWQAVADLMPVKES